MITGRMKFCLHFSPVMISSERQVLLDLFCFLLFYYFAPVFECGEAGVLSADPCAGRERPRLPRTRSPVSGASDASVLTKRFANLTTRTAGENSAAAM
jgi:hypothetical protein